MCTLVSDWFTTLCQLKYYVYLELNQYSHAIQVKNPKNILFLTTFVIKNYRAQRLSFHYLLVQFQFTSGSFPVYLGIRQLYNLEVILIQL